MSSPPQFNEDALKNASREEIMTALFARMIVQQTNMAMIFLGMEPNPDTGEMTRDLEAAKFFIDQLEMIDDKTRGNLTPQEKHLLGQSLTTLRMSFVEAMDNQSADTPKTAEPHPPASPEDAGAGPKDALASVANDDSGSETTATPDPEPEFRKKFTKKY